MDLYDWLLFLHVLSAFALVGSLTVLWGLVLGTREPVAFAGGVASSVGKWAGIGVGVGLAGTLLLGIWLALDVDAYELWDGWIVSSLILWAFSGWVGGKAGKEFARGPQGRRSWIRYQAMNSVAVVLVLALMIWKPGA